MQFCIETKRNSKMRYEVTKNFTAGLLKGLSVTEMTNVPFKVGVEYKNCAGKGRYVVTNVKFISK
jgi:hypothetical protein